MPPSSRFLICRSRVRVAPGLLSRTTFIAYESRFHFFGNEQKVNRMARMADFYFFVMNHKEMIFA